MLNAYMYRIPETFGSGFFCEDTCNKNPKCLWSGDSCLGKDCTGCVSESNNFRIFFEKITKPSGTC